MQPTSRPRIKVCCISSAEEARQAIAGGASALGLVARMPSGPGIISDEAIREIAHLVPPPVASFLLTSETSARQIIAHQRRVRTNTVQLVDDLSEGSYDEIREALPGIRLVQVIHVVGEEAVAEAGRVARHVDAVLLDSGNPKLSTKELGGTGRVHNWEISRRIRESLDVPVFLAGGLRADNVRQAIETVRPFGLDLCSGVRTDGKLDTRKLEEFFEAVKSVDSLK